MDFHATLGNICFQTMFETYRPLGTIPFLKTQTPSISDHQIMQWTNPSIHERILQVGNTEQKVTISMCLVLSDTQKIE
jgi:hypothetical protein